MQKIVLCHTNTCCPTAEKVDGKIRITDDNDPAGEREVILTKEQFKILLDQGQGLL